MELYQLEYFRVLCKYGSYTNASSELSVSQPALSMAIKKLEEECGYLIDRKVKSFSLTKKGEIMLKWAISIHNDVETLRMEMNSLSMKQREIIRFAFPIPLCPDLIGELGTTFTYSHSDVALHIIQEGHAAIVSGLINRTIDIGVICKDFLNPILAYKDFKQVEYWACFPPGHKISGNEFVTPEMLKDETLLLSKSINSISKSIQDYFAPYNYDINYEFDYVFPEDIWQLAKQGRGIVFMPKHVCQENCSPLSPPLYSDLVIVWRKGDTMTHQKEELINFISGL